jgi:hypothetical protein
MESTLVDEAHGKRDVGRAARKDDSRRQHLIDAVVGRGRKSGRVVRAHLPRKAAAPQLDDELAHVRSDAGQRIEARRNMSAHPAGVARGLWVFKRSTPLRTSDLALADKKGLDPRPAKQSTSLLSRLRYHGIGVQQLMHSIPDDGNAVHEHVSYVAGSTRVYETREHVATWLHVRSVDTCHDEVGVLADFNRADQRIEAERPRAVDRREAQSPTGRPRAHTATHVGEQRRVPQLHPRIEVVVARRAIGTEGQRDAVAVELRKSRDS